MNGLEYARPDGRSLHLDLYLPRDIPEPYPLVVWIHGGGWIEGDRSMNYTVRRLDGRGFAFAAIDHRKAHEVSFPDPLLDCRAAIRWLRFNGDNFGLDTECIGVWGESSGGHLALLLGLSAGDEHLDPPEQGGVSSDVQAVCSWFAPTDLLNPGAVMNLGDHDAPGSPLYHLLNGPLNERVRLAALASPVSHIRGDAPPVLLVHGREDDIVSYRQSMRLDELLRGAGAESELMLIEGAGHGGDAFTRPEVLDRVTEFFSRTLRRRPAKDRPSA